MTLRKLIIDSQSIAEVFARPVSRDVLRRLATGKSARDRLVALSIIQQDVAASARRPAYRFELARQLIGDRSITCRWQAMIALGFWLTTAPAAVWEICKEHGCSADADMRAAVGCVLLEHLIEVDRRYLAKARALARRSSEFKATLDLCWNIAK